MERELKYDPVQRSNEIDIHAWLLIWSWGFLIPVGTLIWTHTKKHRELQPYPDIHIMSSGVIGIVLAIAGFAYGVDHFSTFSRGNVSSFRMAHAVIGTIATTGMMVQVLLLAFMRRANIVEPHPSEMPLWQKVGHHAHRYMGWVWMACGLVACELGTHIASVVDPEYLHLGLDHENEKYAVGFIAALATTAVVATAIVIMYGQFAGEGGEATIAPEPFMKPPIEQEQETNGYSYSVETPPPEEAFEVGDLEMENVILSQ
ncbi:hypothetical protein ACHAXR_003354 [Thalassiosira sp. AJA248-18]